MVFTVIELCFGTYFIELRTIPVVNGSPIYSPMMLTVTIPNTISIKKSENTIMMSRSSKFTLLFIF